MTNVYRVFTNTIGTYWVAKPGHTVLEDGWGTLADIEMSPSEQSEFLRGFYKVPDDEVPSWLKE